MGPAKFAAGTETTRRGPGAAGAGRAHAGERRRWPSRPARRAGRSPGTSGANPNGSAGDIAGICNEAGNVVGLMPHPEHAIDPLTGPSADGLGFFTSVLLAAARA